MFSATPFRQALMIVFRAFFFGFELHFPIASRAEAFSSFSSGFEFLFFYGPRMMFSSGLSDDISGQPLLFSSDADCRFDSPSRLRVIIFRSGIIIKEGRKRFSAALPSYGVFAEIMFLRSFYANTTFFINTSPRTSTISSSIAPLHDYVSMILPLFFQLIRSSSLMMRVSFASSIFLLSSLATIFRFSAVIRLSPSPFAAITMFTPLSCSHAVVAAQMFADAAEMPKSLARRPAPCRAAMP